MLFFIIILTISQIVSFFLIFNKIKPFIKPKQEGILLEKIPDKPTYESLDPSHKLVYDVMESAKLENWKVEVEADISIGGKNWVVNFESPTGINIRSRIRHTSGVYSNNLSLSSFTILNGNKGFIRGYNGSITLYNESKIKDDVLSFLWSYILEYHEKENEETRKYYQNTIDDISSKLKTLRRSERLNNILKL
jgi:hypothetical protein